MLQLHILVLHLNPIFYCIFFVEDSPERASFIEMMAEGGPGGPRGMMPPYAGPGANRSIDLLRRFHRHEMMDEMMEMDIEMEMMYGGEMEDV